MTTDEPVMIEDAAVSDDTSSRGLPAYAEGRYFVATVDGRDGQWPIVFRIDYHPEPRP